MKTMRAPKMDVVRFTESDVIVASSPVYSIYIKGFNNEAHGDGVITFLGTDYTDNNSLTGALSGYGLSTRVQAYLPEQYLDTIYSTHDMYHMDSLAGTGAINPDTGEEIQTSIMVTDGTYRYDGYMFVHHQ